MKQYPGKRCAAFVLVKWGEQQSRLEKRNTKAGCCLLLLGKRLGPLARQYTNLHCYLSSLMVIWTDSTAPSLSD